MTSIAVMKAKAVLRKLAAGAHSGSTTPASGPRVADYWTRHNVTLHKRFVNVDQSLEYLHWRNAQYFNYIELMPVSRFDEQVVLDLGCGPGNDLVGFGHFSRPARLIGADVSPSSLEEAKARARLHGLSPELCLLDPASPALPLESASIDYIHSSGVLHHLPHPEQTLRECKRVLRSHGRMKVMVYNYSSLWLHLYVSYIKRIVEGIYKDLDIRDAFARTTDGPDCPIARVYKPSEFIEFSQGCGFKCEFLGSAVSMWEMSFLSRRFDAVMSRELETEHREFLLALRFDDRGYPVYQGHYAGVDGCYLLTPA